MKNKLTIVTFFVTVLLGISLIAVYYYLQNTKNNESSLIIKAAIYEPIRKTYSKVIVVNKQKSNSSTNPDSQDDQGNLLITQQPEITQNDISPSETITPTLTPTISITNTLTPTTRISGSLLKTGGELIFLAPFLIALSFIIIAFAL